MKKFELTKNLEKRLNSYKTYYQILGVNPNNLTDEIVKEVYEDKCKQLEMMLKDYRNEGMKEIRDMIQTTLDDAYRALKSEESRKNYQELLEKINEAKEIPESKKLDNLDDEIEL